MRAINIEGDETMCGEMLQHRCSLVIILKPSLVQFSIIFKPSLVLAETIPFISSLMAGITDCLTRDFVGQSSRQHTSSMSQFRHIMQRFSLRSHQKSSVSNQSRLHPVRVHLWFLL